MEAGYDYLLMRSRLQHRFIRGSAIFLVIIGALLLSAGAAYFIYAQKARSDLDDLNYAVPSVPGTNESVTAITGVIPSKADPEVSQPPSVPPVVPVESAVPPVAPVQDPTGDSSAPSKPDTVIPPVQGGQTTVVTGVGETPPETRPQISASAIADQQLYPGEAIKSTYWNNTLEYEPSASLIQGFKPFDPSSAAPVGSLSVPSRILIPSIGVDSLVTGLGVLDLGDSRAYETPKHVVGHIPELANPGEMGSAWFFGHLESPIAGEGNVFYTLPGIPDLLRRGLDVYAIIESGPTSYLYRIVETRVVHQNEMHMYDTGRSTIHLVSCVPRFVYDHRLIVTGELVGIRS